MSDFAADEPTRKGSKRLDTFALVTEYAMALETKGDGKVNWNEIAQIIGSASGQAALKCWQGIKKKNEAAKKDGTNGDADNGALKPKAAKVEKKPRANKKAANDTAELKSPKSPKKNAKAAKKSTSPAPPKPKKGRKAAKKEVVSEPQSDEDEKTTGQATNANKEQTDDEDVDHETIVKEDKEDQNSADNGETEIGA